MAKQKHKPTYVEVSKNQWKWLCSCGEEAKTYVISKDASRIVHAKHF